MAEKNLRDEINLLRRKVKYIECNSSGQGSGDGGTSNPVSATQPGIVNNEKLQELGGVDKTVNGIRIGRGAGATANNTAFGSSAAANNDTGTSNTALGSFVLNKNIVGKQNTGVGSLALRDNLGSYNTATGMSALKVNTTGSNNAAFGDYALFQNTTGTWNTALGSSALQANTTGQRNIAIASALYWNTSGSFNSGLGINAGYGNTTGSYNTYAGYSSGYNVGTGSYNVAYGYKTLVTSGEGIPASTLNANRNVFLGSSIKFVDGMNDTLAIDNKGATFTDAKDALIYGGFSLLNRFIKFNGQLSVNPAYIPNADATYTKHIVAKPDGTFGWEDKPVINNSYSTTETKTGGTWIDGKPIYRKVISYILTANFQGEFLVEHNLKIENYLKIMFISSEHTGKLKLFELSDIPVSNNVSTQNTPFTILSPDYNLKEDILQVEEILAGSGSDIVFNIILEYTKTTD